MTQTKVCKQMWTTLATLCRPRFPLYTCPHPCMLEFLHLRLAFSVSPAHSHGCSECDPQRLGRQGCCLCICVLSPPPQEPLALVQEALEVGTSLSGRYALHSTLQLTSCGIRPQTSRRMSGDCIKLYCNRVFSPPTFVFAVHKVPTDVGLTPVNWASQRTCYEIWEYC